MTNIFLILLTTIVFSNESFEKNTVIYFNSTFEVVDCPDPKWKLSSNQICIEKTIDKNGNLLWKKSWTTNYRHGRWTKFHSNGKKLYEGLYDTGKKVGDWIEFYKSGRIKQIEVYDGSVNRSILKKLSYHSNGKVYVEKIYKFYQNNLGKEEKIEHGKWTYYNEDGSIEKVEEYKNGKLIK